MWSRLILSFLYSQRLPWSSDPCLLHLQNAKVKVICILFKRCDNPTQGFLYGRKAICQLSHFTISVNYYISETWLAPNATNSTGSGIMFPLVISLAYKIPRKKNVCICSNISVITRAQMRYSMKLWYNFN